MALIMRCFQLVEAIIRAAAPGLNAQKMEPADTGPRAPLIGTGDSSQARAWM